MGRFRDLWASGKFAIKQKQEDMNQQEHEALDMIHELSPDYAVTDASKVILDALKSRRGQETGRWLKSLVPEETVAQAHQNLEAQSAAASAVSAFDQIVEWMDALFKQFTELAFDFNKQAAGTDLLISYEKPKLYEKKSGEVWYKPVTKTYQGRLATRFWALVVRGRDAKVGLYLIPASMLLAFNADQVSDQEMQPFMEVTLDSAGGGWMIAQEQAPLTAIPHLAKELFGDLIRVASGAMAESEVFTSHTQEAGPKLGENVAVGYDHESAQKAKSAQQADAQNRTLDIQNLNVFDACDIVDQTTERELQRMYKEASQLGPGSAKADMARKQISAIESFRMKMLEAFEEFTTATQSILAAEPSSQEQLSRK